MLYLRQSTAVTISFGPAVLFSDGVTLVINLTGTAANQTENTTTGIRLSKNGGAFAARGATAGASTYDAFGNYLVPLNATDTGTLGALRMQYANAAAFCPIFQDFMVLNTSLWDALFAGSGGAIPNLVAGASGGLPTLDAALTVSALAVDIGTAQAGAANTVTLRAGASASDSVYNAGVVSIYTGTGAGQSRVIIGYVGSTKVATVGRNWAVNPDATSVYKLHGLAVPRIDDNFAVLIQAAGAGLTALGDTRIANLDATVSSRTKPADTQAAVTLVTTTTNLTTNNDKTGYGLSAAAVQAIWDALTSALTTVGSIGKKLADWVIGTSQTGDSFARIGAAGVGLTAIDLPNQTMDIVGNITGNLSGSVGSVTGAVGSVVGAVGSVTGLTASNLDATVSSRLASAGYTVPPSAIENADGLLNRNMATGTDSGSPSVRTVRQALRFLRNYWTISAGTLTVRKEDDLTASWTAAVTGTAGADPVTTVDPV